MHFKPAQYYEHFWIRPDKSEIALIETARKLLMRTSKTRTRSKQNRNRSVGNVVNRVFDSSGPEGKVRGTPQQIIEKYNQLARDAQLSNDRVAAENFQQHAEHYQRMLGQAVKEQDARREQLERENRERQAERDRERSERNQGTDENMPITDEFIDDLAESEQPQISSMPVVEDKIGLIETPENGEDALEQSQNGNKLAGKQRRKPMKLKKTDEDNSSEEKKGGNNGSSSSDGASKNVA